jgi:outer membrane immunogenic protein
MTKITSRWALLVMALIAGTAAAQSETPWAGFNAGLNIGGAFNDTCNSWTLSGARVDPAIETAFNNRNCPSNGSFVGGVQFGYNYQYKRLVFGFGAEYEGWFAKDHDRTLKYSGETPPPGTYTFSGKVSPSGFGIIGPKIGYGGLQWLPYVRVGSIITGGSHDSTLNYSPTGAKEPTATFSGGKNFTSTGWVAGGGVEYGLNGPWSITAEFLHANLGKGSNSTTACSGSASACADFSGLSLDSIHNSFTANIFRVGFRYYFSYWDL